MKKINVYYNKYYLFTTQKYNTIKEIKKEFESRNGEEITIAGIPSKTHKIDDIKKYSFEIIKK